MDLRARLRLLLVAAAVLVVGALFFAVFLTVFAALLIGGAVLMLVAYVRLRLLARRVRKAVAEELARQHGNPPGARAGGAIDADFKVER